MSWIEDPGVDLFDGLDLRELKTDQAYLRATGDRLATLYSLSSDCHECPYTKLGYINSTEEQNIFTIDVKQSSTYRIYDSILTNNTIHVNSSYVCEVKPDCGQFGVYDLTLKGDKCEFTESKEAVNIYLPILVTIFILIGVGALYNLICFFKRKYFKLSSSSFHEKPNARRRIQAIDTFRGMSIVLMIFVNDGAGGYWWMEHATWNGLTVGDLVFPCFIWIMGVCIPISVKSLISKSVPKYISLIDIFRRSCTLFLFGVALNTLWGPSLTTMRIFGVLQRFGVAYFFVASLAVLMSKKWKGESENKIKAMFQDIFELGWQWMIMLVLIVIHLGIVFLLPVPGCETGYLGPGGKHENWKHKDCIGGATKYVDDLIIGEKHLYQWPTAKAVYESQAFDPEGIFGCILTIVHVFFGVQAGNTLIHFQEWKQLIVRWMGWALITGLIGGVLCNFSQNDGLIPVNKNLWSLSYVLVMSCFSFILLSICYILIDVVKIWNGSPFIQPGMNAIVMYVGHMMCFQIFPFHWAIPYMETHFIRLMENLWGTVLWIAIAYVLVHKKIFITI